MPQPAYLDLSLYLPAGGVNGFEVNGFAVNGVGFVDSPFAGVVFALDPYRSIPTGVGNTSDLSPLLPSVTAPELSTGYQRTEVSTLSLEPARIQSTMVCERTASSLEPQIVSGEMSVEATSVVRDEYRTAFIPANYPSTTTSEPSMAYETATGPSRSPDPVEISYVRAENRTVTIPRGDT